MNIELQHNIWPIIALSLGTLISALTLAVQHWFPMAEKPRLRSYIMGTSALWIGFALWRFLLGDVWTPLGLAIIDVLGGLTVILAYQIDEASHAKRQANAAQRNDDELA